MSQGKVMFAPHTVAGDSYRAETPQMWSRVGYRGLGNSYPYDRHPDGKQLAIIAATDEDGVAQDKVVFFFDFGDYLKKIAPVTKP